MSISGIIALSVIGGLLIIAAIFLFVIVPMKSWLTGIFSKAYVPMHKLASLRSRNIKPMPLVNFFIMAKNAGLNIKFSDLEAFFLAGGNCGDALSAMTFAKSAGINIEFDKIKSICFAGKNPIEIVKSAVQPKKIMLKDIKAISQDNKELIIDVAVTLRYNIKSIVGAPDEETIKAKVQRQVITNVALAPNHKTVLEKPQSVVFGALDSKQYEGFAYSVLSVEVARVDLGRDIGAEMLAKDAQRQIAQAQVEAERAKSEAMIETEQMKTRAEEMKAAVLEAEAEVPKAIADAIKEGRFSIMDYYKLMNLQADTAMRRSVMMKGDEGGE